MWYICCSSNFKTCGIPLLVVCGDFNGEKGLRSSEGFGRFLHWPLLQGGRKEHHLQAKTCPIILPPPRCLHRIGSPAPSNLVRPRAVIPAGWPHFLLCPPPLPTCHWRSWENLRQSRRPPVPKSILHDLWRGTIWSPSTAKSDEGPSSVILPGKLDGPPPILMHAFTFLHTDDSQRNPSLKVTKQSSPQEKYGVLPTILPFWRNYCPTRQFSPHALHLLPPGTASSGCFGCYFRGDMSQRCGTHRSFAGGGHLVSPRRTIWYFFDA